MAYKNVSFICYNESLTEDISKKMRRLLDKGNVKTYAYILHDKDILEDGSPKKPHYHVIIQFYNEVNKSMVANLFDISPNLVQGLSNFVGSIGYMVHLGSNEKYQYEKTDIQHYGFDIEEVFKQLGNHGISESQILDQLITWKQFHFPNATILRMCIENGYLEVYKKYYMILREIN